MILGAKDSNLFVDPLGVEDLEELNSDYINEHYGSLQDDAYQKGLDDAWECARELYLNGACKDWFGEYFNAFIKNHTAQEAIEKLKAHKQDDKIEVGDIVERYLDNKLDSTGIYLGDADEKGDYWNCLFWTGASYITLGYPKYQFKKTGRHFDIASILEEMKHD